MTKGVITGCNEKQEWLLKTWWDYYSKSNDYPVTFMDFGMSNSARIWCEKRGSVVSIPVAQVDSREDIPKKRAVIWEKLYKDIWNARPFWFTKPQALLQSPYAETAWIDMDTFVIRPLTGLFDACKKTGITLALEFERAAKRARDHNCLLPGEQLYNTGIIGYQKKHPLIQKWADKCWQENRRFLGDQDVFSRIVYEENIPVYELPRIFNWSLVDGMRDDVVIIHFAYTGKQCLYINLKTWDC